MFPVTEQEPKAVPVYEEKKQRFDHGNEQQNYEDEMDYPLNKRILIICLASYIFLFIFISVAGRRLSNNLSPFFPCKV